MTDIRKITGIRLALRLVEVEDASYIHGLRTNPHYNRYLSKVTGTVIDQAIWIEKYKQKEAQGLEYYYVIERIDGAPCGVVRIYDISGSSFTWGSWILAENKPRLAALESALLSFRIGFGIPEMQQALIEVQRANEHAQAFYHRFGMTLTEHSGHEIQFTYSKERFLKDYSNHLSAITAGNGS